jgi:hypothetical protein
LIVSVQNELEMLKVKLVKSVSSQRTLSFSVVVRLNFRLSVCVCVRLLLVTELTSFQSLLFTPPSKNKPLCARGFMNKLAVFFGDRSQLPRGLRDSAAARLLQLLVRIPTDAWCLSLVSVV